MIIDSLPAVVVLCDDGLGQEAEDERGDQHAEENGQFLLDETAVFLGDGRGHYGEPERQTAMLV